MARWWIGLLLLLNAALLAWNMGALASWSWAPGSRQEGPAVTVSVEPPVPPAPASAPAVSPAAPASVPKVPASAPRPKPVASVPESD